MRNWQEEARRADAAVLESLEWIKDIARAIYARPETGFREFQTARFVVEKSREAGIEAESLQDIPAVRAVIDTGRPGPTVAIMGEMDSILCSEHPDCDPETGAVHACGHHAQIAAMLGALRGVLDSGVLQALCGKLVFMAVPAEEYIEVAYRMQLRDQGILSYLGGKPELMRRGWFDDVDISMMVHLSEGEKPVQMSEGAVGCMAKMIAYKGKAAHAGGSPHRGVNAVYAATLGLSAINAVRETFRERDLIRVHPIITKGGDAVNVIPCDVRMETFVRGRTIEAILEAAEKVDRALGGGAYAMGAQVEIRDVPGYMPFINDENLTQSAEETLDALGIEYAPRREGIDTGSTDMGDLSMVMPVLQPYVTGSSGGMHTSEFRVTDEDRAFGAGARMLAGLAVRLLSDGGERAKKAIEEYCPHFKSIREYLDFQDVLFKTKVLP